MEKHEIAQLAEVQEIIKQFMAKIENIKQTRDKRIQAIIEKYQAKKINELLEDIDNIKDK